MTFHLSQECVLSALPQSERMSPQMSEPVSNGRERLSQKCVGENEGEKKEMMIEW